MDPNENLDPNLNGESAETPAASPAETTTPDGSTTVNPKGAGTSSPEEVVWNSLTGSSQDRFRQVTRDLNDYRRKEQEWQEEKDRLSTSTVYKPQTASTPEVADAVRKLSDVGIATKDEVEQKINQRLGNLVYTFELEKLEGKYDGGDGLPAFSKDEYEDYVTRNPQYRNYTPEDVYRKMYEPEIFEWKVQNQGKPRASTKPSSSLRPTGTQVREEPLTPESIEQRLNEPDGMQWYEKNRDRINSSIAKLATAE